MERLNHLGYHLPGGKMVRLAVCFPLHREFAGHDIGRIRHRMRMPWELRVWRNRQLEHRQLRLAGWVGRVRLTIPGDTALQQGFCLYRGWRLTSKGAIGQQDGHAHSQDKASHFFSSDGLGRTKTVQEASQIIVLIRLLPVNDGSSLSRGVMLAARFCITTCCMSMWFVRGVPASAFRPIARLE